MRATADSMNWSDVATASVTLFLVMDPLGNIPIFHSVLAGFGRRRRMLVMARELCLALVVLLAFLLAGNTILGFLGLSQSSLNIAGGVLLFMISIRMIFPRSVATADDTEHPEDPFLVPLAVPLIAGPSTIAILLLLSSNDPGRLLEWSIALFIAWLATTLLLVASPFLLGFLGTRGSRAIERLMGMILVILATQMLLNGVRDFVESL